METDLIPKYSNRKSFYSKARIKQEGNKIILISYNTEVAYIENGKCFVLGQWGETTTSHIKEFLKQNGFKADNITQILKDYGK